MNQRLSNLETSKTSTIFHISKFLMQIGQDLIQQLILMKLLTCLTELSSMQLTRMHHFASTELKEKTLWINEKFLNAIRERDFFSKEHHCQNPDDWKAFKRKRNSTNKLKNTLKQTFLP